MAEVYTSLPGLKHQLQRAGISQAALGKKLGVTRASVNYWVTGTTVPRLDTLLSIMDVLGCQLSDLVTAPEDNEYDNTEKETRP